MEGEGAGHVEDTQTVEERQAAIAAYDVLGRPASDELQSLVDLTARIFDVHGASANVITAHEEHSVAAAGVDAGVCARDDSLCSVFLAEQATVVVPDASRDERFAANPFVNGAIGRTRFYASAPMRTPSGVPVGRLCIFDDSPRRLSDAERRTLQTLAGQVMNLLELRVRTRELEQSEAALAEAREELRRANEHLTLFAGQVSHDLRTPLTAITANAEMMTGEPEVRTSEDLTWMVDGVTRAAGRMNVLIENILDYAREGGRLRVEPLDLGELCRAALEELRPVIESSGAEVAVGDLPTVAAGRHQLYAVFLNLLSNAVKFTRPGELPVIRVTAQRHDDRWRIAVTDQGIGIPEDREAQMFVLFARADKRVQGDGIGLATVKRVVEAHGGRVGIETPPEGGTTVWFELPA